METASIVFHPFFTVAARAGASRPGKAAVQRPRDAGLPGELALRCWEGEGGRLDSVGLRRGVAGLRSLQRRR